MNMAGNVIRTWDSDVKYVADQCSDSSWNHNTEFGICAANKFVQYGNTILKYGWLYHDDTVADFGGNDGFAANEFFIYHGISPLVIDCEPTRLHHAREEYGLKTLECFVEDIPLPDDSIDWGYTSHTLEHSRDPDKALAEIARVVKRACMFLVPLERPGEAAMNRAHSVACSTVADWKRLLKPHWKIKGAALEGKQRGEVQMFALPRKVRK